MGIVNFVRAAAGTPPGGRRGTRRILSAGGLLVAVAVALAVTGSALKAGAGVQPFSLSPTQGPPGTVVTASGTGCSPGLPASPSANFVRLVAPWPLQVDVPVQADGSWSLDVSVPDAALALPGAVTAACFSSGLPSLDTIYTPVVFTVTSTPPTTSAPPTTAAPPATSGPAVTTKPGSTPTNGSAPNGGGGTASQGGSTGPGTGSAASGSGSGSTHGGVSDQRGSGALQSREAGDLVTSRRHALDQSSSGIPWWVWVLVAVAVVALVGGWWLWQRARRRGNDVNLGPRQVLARLGDQAVRLGLFRAEALRRMRDGGPSGHEPQVDGSANR